jgi:predicted esterase
LDDQAEIEKRMIDRSQPSRRVCRFVPIVRTITIAFTLACVWAGAPALAQGPTGRFVDQSLRDDSGEHKYVVFVPAGYRADKPSPAILYLHGAGERGTDNRFTLTAGLPPFVQARAKTFPFVVVIPQCESAEARILEAWQAHSPDGQRALRILDDAQKHFNIDPKRIVLSGWSMGAYGAWSLGMAEPQRWSAIVPLAGGGDVGKIAALKDVPVWAFHGGKDKLIKTEQDARMVDALKAAGGTATLTELPDVGHYLCDAVYGNHAVVQWMLDPGKSPTELGPNTVKPVAPVEIPFIPEVEISQAVGIRLGNDALAAMSYAIPQSVPREMLTGRLNDMFDSTVASGRQFSIRFSGLSYSGQLERVIAKGYGKGRILVQMGLRNVTIAIGSTSVTGERHAAQAGQINIVIGQNYPVWLNLELAPYIADRRLRLKQVGASFQIPGDNWYVTQPAGVSVQGFGMTQEAVVSGLTSGLYGAKGRIENEVLSIVPRIVEEVEKYLVLPDTGASTSEVGQAMSKLWPLPIYPPRLRVWPEQIVTDEKGISLVVGITAARLNPYGPDKPLRKVPSAGTSLEKIPTDNALHAIVSPQILTSLTEMAVEADQLKLDLLDISEPSIQKLADRAELQMLIPDLKQFGDALQVRSTLRVIRPLYVGDPAMPEPGDGSRPLEFRMNGVQITIDIKTDPAQSTWQPCATFDFDISEQLRASLAKPAHDLRVVTLDWLADTSIKGTARFADSYKAKDSTLDADRYFDQFKQGWAALSKGASAIKLDVPDLVIGSSKLRMNEIRWEPPLIEVTYNLARIKITNLSKEAFTYETKAPTSSWGEPLTLKPGDSHEFEIPYPLTYRRRTDAGMEVYTLVVGSHSEFRVPLAGGAPRLFSANRP